MTIEFTPETSLHDLPEIVLYVANTALKACRLPIDRHLRTLATEEERDQYVATVAKMVVELSQKAVVEKWFAQYAVEGRIQ